MSMPSFAHYFRQPELSDADMLIKLSKSADDPGEHPAKRMRGEDSDKLVAKFPCHQIIVFTADYFKTQVQHWQLPGSTASDAAPSQQRPTLTLTIDSAEQQPAAEAVIAAMYGVTDAFEKLQQQQQLVHAVMIADRVQVSVALQQAVQALKAAAMTREGLSGSVLETLASMYPWPGCLQRLLPVIVGAAPCCDNNGADFATIKAADTNSRIQRMLLAVLGDLEEVWADPQLKGMLLQLPLPALQLLLNSDDLRVANEDTVLFTVNKYLRMQRRPQLRSEALAALPQLVRPVHLSRFALACAALSLEAQEGLLAAHLPRLKQLVTLRFAAGSATLSAADIQRLLPSAPASWRAGPRQVIAPRAVQVTWKVPVQKIQQLCKKALGRDLGLCLHGPESPPLGGVAWRLKLCCLSSEDLASVQVGVAAEAVDAPAGVYGQFQCRVFCANNGQEKATTGPTLEHSLLLEKRWQDFFELGPMAGGWDEAAWVAKQLPAAGDLEMLLTVHSVS